MTLALADYLALGFLSLVGGWLGAYLGGYLNQKGLNLASHEDIQKLAAQVKATEDVKAGIASRAWVSQEMWKRKADFYFDVLTMLDTISNDYMYLAKSYRTRKVDADRDVRKATAHLQRIMVMMQIVAPQAVHLMQDANVPSIEGEEDVARAERHATVYRRIYMALAEEARRDLGLSGSAR